jgi:hypothetical protein
MPTEAQVQAEIDALPEYIDGPKFAAWLKAIHPELEGQWTALVGERMTKNMSAWKRGNYNATIDAADKLLVKLGRHLSEVPDEFFISRGR